MNARFSKSILILAAAGLLGAASVYAGNGPGDGSCDGSGDGICDNTGQPAGGQQNKGGPAERMAGMARRLGLTLEQQIQALELFDAQAYEQEQMRARIADQYGAEICAQRAQFQAELRAMLTPEQQALHDEMIQQRELNRANRPGGGFGGLECPADG
jgi:Spy/CpxP family protein refolding chaperone